MVKFARKKSPPNVTAPVVSRSDAPDALTAEGGAELIRDAKSELFLLALTNMVGEATFYEAARDRDRRFANLIKEVTASDPAWIGQFVPFLRETMHLAVRERCHGRRIRASADRRRRLPINGTVHTVGDRGRPRPCRRAR